MRFEISPKNIAKLCSRVTLSLFVAFCLAAGCSANDAEPGKLPGGAGAAGGSGGSGGSLSGGASGSPFGGTSGGGIRIEAGSQDSMTDGGCAYAHEESDFVPANLLFVIDRSGSMNCNLPPITTSEACESNPVRADAMQPSKWEIVVKALKDGFAALPPTASAGLSFFTNNDICGVNSIPSVGINRLDATQISALSASLDAVPLPKGGTAIIGATVLAYQHMHQEAKLTGNKFVVLLTDGAETCNPEAGNTFVTEIQKAISVGIRTFVIGAPGSEKARSMLSNMAFLGGTASSPSCDHHSGAPFDQGDCHFDMTSTQNFAAALSQALADISGQALSCEFDVPAKSPDGRDVDLGKVNVYYTKGDGSGSRKILKDDTRPCDGSSEGGAANGWQYSAGNTKIVLCGSICDEVKADKGSKIDIEFGCPTQTVR